MVENNILSHFLGIPNIVEGIKQVPYWQPKWEVSGATQMRDCQKKLNLSNRPQGAPTTDSPRDVFEAL